MNHTTPGWFIIWFSSQSMEFDWGFLTKFKTVVVVYMDVTDFHRKHFVIRACLVSALLQNNKDLRIFENFGPKKETINWEARGSEKYPKDEMLKNVSLPYSINYYLYTYLSHLVHRWNMCCKLLFIISPIFQMALVHLI